MSEELLVYEKLGKTAVITLNRPKYKSAIDESLRAAIRAARQDASVAWVVPTGAGAQLASGGDEIEKPFAVRELLDDAHRWFAELADPEEAVISAVDGFAVGAGFSLAPGADFVIASERATSRPTRRCRWAGCRRCVGRTPARDCARVRAPRFDPAAL